jgi:hypothetical protein
MLDDYRDALARADEGLPAEPADAALLATGDVELVWAEMEYDDARRMI